MCAECKFCAGRHVGLQTYLVQATKTSNDSTGRSISDQGEAAGLHVDDQTMD